MTAEHAATTRQNQPQPPKNGWLKNLLLTPITWWPVTLTAIPVTIISCYPYTIAFLQIQNGHLLSGAAIAAFALFINLSATGIVCAAWKCTKSLEAQSPAISSGERSKEITWITIIVTVIAFLPYFIAALQAQNGHLLPAAGVAAFGLALNLLPPILVRATFAKDGERPGPAGPPDAQKC